MQAGVLIIAECGINHNGDEHEAYRLINAAVDAGADVAKFQLYKPELLALDMEKRAMLEQLLLPRDAYQRLSAFAKARGIGFACTAFDAGSLTWLLENTKMNLIKIGSGQWDNKKLLTTAFNSLLPVVQSVKESGAIMSYGKSWRYLHVVPEYPTPPEHANLKRVKESWCSGLSDHSGEIFASLAAVAMGAHIIECHITMDKNNVGPDHSASLNPAQFKEMVRGIRMIEKAMR